MINNNQPFVEPHDVFVNIKILDVTYKLNKRQKEIKFKNKKRILIKYLKKDILRIKNKKKQGGGLFG